ncbi:hypothetical protein L873DRAFT_1681194, partial [Choiromyces venosus 120613-1]
SSQSSWNKQQATIQLTIFTDSILHSLVLFCRMGVGAMILMERENYDPHIVVKFNSKAHANSSTIVE